MPEFHSTAGGKQSQWLWEATCWMRGALSCGQRDRSSLAHAWGSNHSGLSLPAQASPSLLPEAFADHGPLQLSPTMRTYVDPSIHPSILPSIHPNFLPSNYLSSSLPFFPPSPLPPSPFPCFLSFLHFSFLSPSFFSLFLSILSAKPGIQSCLQGPPHTSSVGETRIPTEHVV